jgi:glucan phosphoethanolaminetransferase (alkaline phosphatase superfamily)
MAAVKTPKSANTIRWVTRIIGLPVSLLLFLGYTFQPVREVVSDLHTEVTANLLLAVAFGFLVLLAYMVSWRWERVGALLFLLASVTQVIGIQFYANPEYGYFPATSVYMSPHIVYLIRDWAWIGFPMLIMGILFFVASWLSRRKDIVPGSESFAPADLTKD